MMWPAIQRQLEDAISAPPPSLVAGDVYAVLDGASVRQLPDYLEDNDAEFACLFSGESDPLVLTRAPYLVRVEPGDAIFAWILQEGWGRNWGMFAVVPRGTSFDDVLDHFREFLQVRLPDGRIVFFRFYDPRVQRLFLRSCDAAQASQLFAIPIAWSCESDDGSALLVHTSSDGAVSCQGVPLDSFHEAVTGPGSR
jgi:hypothetical protein